MEFTAADLMNAQLTIDAKCIIKIGFNGSDFYIQADLGIRHIRTKFSELPIYIHTHPKLALDDFVKDAQSFFA